jgi:hypothetical protein
MMETKNAVKVLITFEVKEYSEDYQEYQETYYDDYYSENSNSDEDTYELVFSLPDSRDELIDILERWVDYIPDDYSQSEIEDGFGMIDFEDGADDFEDLAEFGARDPEQSNQMNTSIPQKIIVYFEDGSEEEVEITGQEETLNRVLNLIGE